MTFDTQCGIRLKEERERLGLSQQEAADKIGIRREMWGRYERGQASPGGDALTAFQLAGGDLIYVLTGELGTAAITSDERKLLAFYRKLDVRGKAGVSALINGMGEKGNAPRAVFHGNVGQVVQGDQTTKGVTFTVESSHKKEP